MRGHRFSFVNFGGTGFAFSGRDVPGPAWRDGGLRTCLLPVAPGGRSRRWPPVMPVRWRGQVGEAEPVRVVALLTLRPLRRPDHPSIAGLEPSRPWTRSGVSRTGARCGLRRGAGRAPAASAPFAAGRMEPARVRGLWWRRGTAGDRGFADRRRRTAAARSATARESPGAAGPRRPASPRRPPKESAARSGGGRRGSR